MTIIKDDNIDKQVYTGDADDRDIYKDNCNAFDYHPLTRDEAVNQRGGHTEHAHQQVTDGQVEDEEVRYRSHVAIPDDHQADEPISDNAQEKHNQVGENVAHSHACGVDVIRQESAVVQTEVGG